jgi:hypothetical protein
MIVLRKKAEISLTHNNGITKNKKTWQKKKRLQREALLTNYRTNTLVLNDHSFRNQIRTVQHFNHVNTGCQCLIEANNLIE